MPTRPRRVFFSGVVTAHAAALIGLVQCQSTPMRLPRVIKPFDVSIVSEPAITLPEPQPRPLPRPQTPAPPTAPPVPLPEIVVAAPPPPVTVALTPPAPVPTPVAVESVAAAPEPAPAPPALPAPPAPPAAPKRVSADVLRYAIPPPEDFPALSKRLNETGKVLLRVVFDVDGYPRVVALARSSGFTRLDEQALVSMRKARIHPCKENGVAIECELVAAMVYELED